MKRIYVIVVAGVLIGTTFMTIVPGNVRADDLDPSDPFDEGDAFGGGLESWSFGEGSGTIVYIGGGAGEGPGGGVLRLNGIAVYAMGDTGRADYWIRVWARIINQGDSANVLFYYSPMPPGTGDGYVFRADSGSTIQNPTTGFYKISGNNRAGTALQTVGAAIAVNQWVKIDVIVVNHEFYGYINDALIVSSRNDDRSRITSDFSYAPWYSTFPFENNVGLFSWVLGPVDYDGFRFVTDTLYERFNPANPPRWKPVAGTPPPLPVNGWAQLTGAGGAANLIYLNGGQRGYDGFIFDMDFRYQQGGGGAACRCDWLRIYFHGDNVNPAPAGPPQNGYVFKIPLEWSPPPGTQPQLARVTAGVETPIGYSSVLPPASMHFNPGQTYHIRMGAADGEMRVFLDDDLLLTGADTTYRYGGWQISSTQITWGSVLVDNVIVALTSIGDDFSAGNLNRWIVGNGLGAPRVINGAVEVGPVLNSQQFPPYTPGTFGMFFKTNSLAGRSFEFRATASMYITGGNGVWFVFHKYPVGAVVAPFNCVQFLFTDKPGSAMRFEQCNGNGLGAGTPIGYNTNEVLGAGSHSLTIKVGGDTFTAVVDGKFVAEATTTFPYAGDVGVYNDPNSGIVMDDFFIHLDSDGDYLLDAIERGGANTYTGVVSVPIGGGLLTYDFPIYANGNFKPLLRAKLSIGQIATVVVERSGGSFGSNTQITGTGRWQIYPLGGLAALNGGLNTFNLNVNVVASLDWFGLKMQGVVDDSTHIQDATDYTNNPGAGFTKAFRFLTYFSEWQFLDYDVDQVSDYREFRVQFRTTVPLGAVSGNYYDSNVNGQIGGQWVQFRGAYYSFVSSGAAGIGEPGAGSSVLILPDFTDFRLNSSPFTNPPYEDLRIWQGGIICQGCLVSRWTRTLNPPAGAPQNDLPRLGFAGGGEGALQYQGETSNWRYAFLIGVDDDSRVLLNGVAEFHLNLKPIRDSLTSLGYIDDSLNQPCNGAAFDAAWDPIKDRILVANGDPGLVAPCINDRLGNAANVDDAFASLGSVMDANDQLLVP